MFQIYSTICLLLLNTSFGRGFNARNITKNSPVQSSLRIHDGIEVKHDEYPFVVILVFMLNYDFNRQCTGCMITDEWGITAGHCAFRLNTNYYVWYGNYTMSPKRTKLYSQIVQMIEHPGYRGLFINRGTEDLIVDNDLCLFRVSQRISLKSYAKLSSVDRSALIGLPVTYVGGGMTSLKQDMFSNFKPLQKGEAAIIMCDVEMRSKSKYVICITPKCSNRLQRPWYGDSGGPLLFDGKIIGVCAYGIESPVIARSGYAPISPYLDWIYDVMHSKK